jgi:DNA-directed RNA polymerase II subunit RPB1
MDLFPSWTHLPCATMLNANAVFRGRNMASATLVENGNDRNVPNDAEWFRSHNRPNSNWDPPVHHGSPVPNDYEPDEDPEPWFANTGRPFEAYSPMSPSYVPNEAYFPRFPSNTQDEAYFPRFPSNTQNDAHSPTTPSYAPVSPTYSPTSPSYAPDSPAYSPTTPSHVPNGLGHAPDSPAYSPTSPSYPPESPGLAWPSENAAGASPLIIDLL